MDKEVTIDNNSYTLGYIKQVRDFYRKTSMQYVSEKFCIDRVEAFSLVSYYKSNKELFLDVC